MTKNCPKSCTACEGTLKRNRTLVDWEMGENEEKEEDNDPNSVRRMDPDVLLAESAKFGEPQKAEGAQRVKTLDNVASTIDYIKSEQVSSLSSEFRDSCLNRNELCSFWAVIG
jgi:hypothetical protein